MRSLLACALLATAASAQISYFTAYLDGAQETPPVVSPGHGWGIVKLDTATNNVQLFAYHTNLSSATIAAHMHVAPVGVPGGVLIGMALIGTNTWAGSGTLTPADAATLIAGGMYLNVHTVTNGGGEIRGQIVKAKSTRFTAVLNGAQETPPTPSAATGTAVGFLYEPENRLVYVVNSTGLVNVTAAHFHRAAAGVPGPIVVPLTGSNGTYCGVSDRLTTAQLADVMSDLWYANIHTIAFSGGEIRGQMRRDQGDLFAAAADGAQETPPVATAGVGSGCLTIAPNGTISVTGQYSGLTGPAIAAHVHKGAVGVPGGIVFPLTFGGGLLSGTFTPSAADLADLRAGLWYVNVHTAANGGGEIRGQLFPAVKPTTYGEGCPGSNGVLPMGAATDFPCLGATSTFDLYGAAPGIFALMFLGERTDPLDVSIFTGIPGCFLMTSIIIQYVQITDGNGCAKQPVTVPLDPAFRGIPLSTQWVLLDTVGFRLSNGASFVIN